MRYVIDSGAQPASDISPSLKSVVSIALVDNSIRRNIAAMLTCRSIRFYEQIASCMPIPLVLLPGGGAVTAGSSSGSANNTPNT